MVTGRNFNIRLEVRAWDGKFVKEKEYKFGVQNGCNDVVNMPHVAEGLGLEILKDMTFDWETQERRK